MNMPDKGIHISDDDDDDDDNDDDHFNPDLTNQAITFHLTPIAYISTHPLCFCDLHVDLPFLMMKYIYWFVKSRMNIPDKGIHISDDDDDDDHFNPDLTKQTLTSHLTP